MTGGARMRAPVTCPIRSRLGQIADAAACVQAPAESASHDVTRGSFELARQGGACVGRSMLGAHAWGRERTVLAMNTASLMSCWGALGCGALGIGSMLQPPVDAGTDVLVREPPVEQSWLWGRRGAGFDKNIDIHRGRSSGIGLSSSSIVEQTSGE